MDKIKTIYDEWIINGSLILPDSAKMGTYYVFIPENGVERNLTTLVGRVYSSRLKSRLLNLLEYY